MAAVWLDFRDGTGCPTVPGTGKLAKPDVRSMKLSLNEKNVLLVLTLKQLLQALNSQYLAVLTYSKNFR